MRNQYPQLRNVAVCRDAISIVIRIQIGRPIRFEVAVTESKSRFLSVASARASDPMNSCDLHPSNASLRKTEGRIQKFPSNTRKIPVDWGV